MISYWEINGCEVRSLDKPENATFNSTNDLQVIEPIEKESKNKILGITEQYLAIHSPIYSNNRLKVERIDREGKDK